MKKTILRNKCYKSVTLVCVCLMLVTLACVCRKPVTLVCVCLKPVALVCACFKAVTCVCGGVWVCVFVGGCLKPGPRFHSDPIDTLLVFWSNSDIQ